MIQRSIGKITANPWHRGFLGTGHQARAVLDGTSYAESDPFMLFMDDSLDLPGGEPVGGAHPHAGFETLTLVLEGNGKEWQTGSFEVMTAGSGIVHTEEITSKQKVRILQVWLVLPPERRNARPFLQRILREDVPAITTREYEILVYSGTSHGLTSPLKNQTPFTLADYRLAKNVTVKQEIPSHYNGLVYVIEGAVKSGSSIVETGKAGWVESTAGNGNSEIIFESLDEGARFVLYAGQPHNVPVVHHGPFIADTMEDILGMYRDFREGKFPHLDNLPESQRITYRSEVPG